MSQLKKISKVMLAVGVFLACSVNSYANSPGVEAIINGEKLEPIKTGY